MALEVTLESSTIQVESEYDDSNPSVVNLNISGTCDGYNIVVNPTSSWATIQVNLDLANQSGTITVIRCSQNESTTECREQLFTIEIRPYHIEYDQFNNPIQVQDGPSILELTIIQSPALIVPDSAELTPAEMAQMESESINSLRIQLSGSNTTQLITQLLNMSQMSIITIPSSLKNQIVSKICGFAQNKSNINKQLSGIDQEIYDLGGAGNPNSKLAKLERRLANEQSKGDKGRPGMIQDEIDEVNQQINELNQLKQDTQDQYNDYNRHMLEDVLPGSEVLDKIESEIRNFENQCGAVAKALPTLFQNTFTSIFEPMGSVAACAVGPVVTATNPLQILGTLKRLGTSASSMLSCAQSALNSAIYLGLPEKMISPLQSLCTIISVLAALG